MRYTVLFSFLLLFSSCGIEEHVNFDSKKWIPIESGLYIEGYRKKMLKDFTNNYLELRSTTIDSVKTWIGDPIRIDTIENRTVHIYQVEEKYGWDIDPIGAKYLDLTFDQDSILQVIEIREVRF